MRALVRLPVRQATFPPDSPALEPPSTSLARRRRPELRSTPHPAVGTTVLARPMRGPRRQAGPCSWVSLPLRTSGSPGGETASRFRHGSGDLSPGHPRSPCGKDLRLLACAGLELSFPSRVEGDSVPSVCAPIERAAPDRMPAARHRCGARGQSVLGPSCAALDPRCTRQPNGFAMSPLRLRLPPERPCRVMRSGLPGETGGRMPPFGNRIASIGWRAADVTAHKDP